MGTNRKPPFRLHGGTIVGALEDTWAAIREHHPDVPPVVLITGSGRTGARAGSLRLGHHAKGRWATKGKTEHRLSEIFVSGESLHRGHEDVLNTLLHEAVHAVADERGIKDTSRQNRYHNRRFATLAVEVGLVPPERPHPTIGFSSCELSDEARKRYRPQLTALKKALKASIPTTTVGLPSKPPEGGDGEGSSRGRVKAVCSCDGKGLVGGEERRSFRIARSVLALGPITCGMCGDEFREEV